MSFIFYTPINDAGALLAAPHEIGDGHLVLDDASEFAAASPSPTAPIRVCAGPCVFKIIDIDGSTLLIDSLIEGTTDTSLPIDTLVEGRVTAGDIIDLQEAIQTLDGVAAEIGDAITGGVANSVLYVDSSGNLAQSSGEVNPTWITSLAGSKITGNIGGNSVSITGSITESQVTNLVTDLAAKAADTLVLHKVGGETIICASASTRGLSIKSFTGQSVNVFEILSSTGTPQVFITPGGAPSSPRGSITTNEGWGAGTLVANTTGARNAAVGTDAMAGNTTGVDNVAVGNNALAANTTGTNNMAIGQGVLQAAIACINNTAIGAQAYVSVVSGVNHGTAIGAQSDIGKTTGNSCTAIGAFTSTAGFSSATAIGASATSTASNQIMMGTASEYVEIPGNVKVSKGIATAINATAKTATYTLTTSDSTILGDASGGNFAITLPAASGVFAGRTFVVKSVSTGTVTLTAAGSDVIDGSGTYPLASQYKYVVVQSDGVSKWYVIGNN